MALSRDQSISLYGTEAYTGWGETEAMYDARNKGLSGGGSSTSSVFNFDWDAEVDKAYQELGTYYTQLLDWAQGDVNKALSRLVEDYDTGKRFREQKYDIQLQALDLAQKEFSTNAESAVRTMNRLHLARGISRQSVMGGGLGIADVEKQRLKEDLALGQGRLDLQKTGLQTDFEQANKLALTEKTRLETDIPEAFERQKIELEDQRRKKSANMALSRQQRAYNRFESSLV